MTHRAASLALTALVVASMVASTVGVGLAAPGQGGPPDHAGVPDQNVAVGQGNDNALGDPTGGLPDSVPKRAAAWDVHTSAHAADLQVSIEAAESARLQMVLRDDANHDGREISVDASALQQALGYVPTEATIEHDSGRTYQVPVSEHDGYLVFDVERFSQNTITFEGEVNLSSPSATDGAQLQYQLGNATSATDPQGTLTGTEAVEWDNASGAGLADGDTLAVNPAGDEVRNTEVVFEGEGFERTESETGNVSADGGTATVGLDGNLEPRDADGTGDPSLTATFTVPSREYENTEYSSYDKNQRLFRSNGDNVKTPSEMYVATEMETVEKIAIKQANGNFASYLDVNWIRIVPGEKPDGTMGEGTQITEISQSHGGGWLNITLDQPHSVNGQGFTIEFPEKSYEGSISNNEWFEAEASAVSGSASYGGTVQDSAVNAHIAGDKRSEVTVTADDGSTATVSGLDGETDTATINLSASAASLSFDGGTGWVDYTLDYQERAASEDPAVDLDGDGSMEISHSGLLHEGETARYGASSLGVGDDTTTVSLTSGTVGVAVNLQEVSKSRDVTVTLNGQQVASAASLADGETSEFTASASDVLQNGTNTVNISVGDGSLSADAPTPAVGFAMNHSARFDQQVRYAGEQWTERYNVSREWGDGGENASLTIPFEGNVVGIRHLTLFVNGTQTPPTWSHFRENSTTLDVGLGDLDPHAETRVVANASKVRVANGTIRVLDPSLEGDGLDSKVELTSWSSDAYIDVSGTSKADRVHYADAVSWDSDATHVREFANGDQHVVAPNAPDGGTAQIRTLPMTVDPSNAIEVRVERPNPPRFELRAGDTAGSDRVEISYLDVLDSERYALLEQPGDDEVLADHADDGSVTFATDGATQAYTLEQSDASGGSDETVIGVGAAGDGSGSNWRDILAVFAGLVGSVVGTLLLGRRFFGVRGFRATGATAVVGAIAGTVAIEMATAESVVADLLGSFAASGAGTVVIAIALLVGIWQLDARLGLPIWLQVAAGLAVGIWAVDSLTGGALAGSLEELGPLVWLILLVGGIALLWRVLQGPTFIVGGERR